MMFRFQLTHFNIIPSYDREMYDKAQLKLKKLCLIIVNSNKKTKKYRKAAKELASLTGLSVGWKWTGGLPRF